MANVIIPRDQILGMRKKTFIAGTGKIPYDPFHHVDLHIIMLNLFKLLIGLGNLCSLKFIPKP